MIILLLKEMNTPKPMNKNDLMIDHFVYFFFLWNVKRLRRMMRRINATETQEFDDTELYVKSIVFQSMHRMNSHTRRVVSHSTVVAYKSLYPSLHESPHIQMNMPFDCSFRREKRHIHPYILSSHRIVAVDPPF